MMHRLPIGCRNCTINLFRKVVCFAMLACLIFSAGCRSGGWRWGRHLPFYKQAYFSVQLLLPHMAEDDAIVVDSLLLPAPVGNIAEESIKNLHSAIRQELQQILPGSIRTLRKDGSYARYATEANLFLENGKISVDEGVRLGSVAGVSHVLVARVLDYRPYHPQRLVMDWYLLDVDNERLILLVSGGMDAAEHKTRQLAKQFYKARKADSDTDAGLDVMLRSPREYARFTVAQAVNALRGRVKPKSKVLRP